MAPSRIAARAGRGSAAGGAGALQDRQPGPRHARTPPLLSPTVGLTGGFGRREDVAGIPNALVYSEPNDRNTIAKGFRPSRHSTPAKPSTPLFSQSGLWHTPWSPQRTCSGVAPVRSRGRLRDVRRPHHRPPRTPSGPLSNVPPPHKLPQMVLDASYESGAVFQNDGSVLFWFCSYCVY